ncbi:MAG: sulfotransferase family protein, partial [Pseudomonadota bacterium]|nr:sulfotransferase family protein [Pseudomonadota bacterium]
GAQTRMAHTMLVEKTFDGRLDRDHVVSVYRAHNESVKRTVPPERLLAYDVAQGWEPLCAFLGVAVPAAPFPHTNSTAEFRAKISQM